MQKLKIYDINIHSFSIKELENIFTKILISSDQTHLITTFNLDFLRNATINKYFFKICKNAFLNLPDGIGIIHLLKTKYHIKIERITGNDIFPLLLKMANDNKYRVVLVGSTKTVLDKVELKIRNRYKNLNNNLLCISPIFHFEYDEKLNMEIVNEIKFFKPDIVFVALGSPRQEIWLYQNMNIFHSKINIGIGAVFDFFSGEKRRSPIVFQKLGLEWLWRLSKEPTRLFKRYIIYDLPFFLKSILYKNY